MLLKPTERRFVRRKKNMIILYYFSNHKLGRIICADELDALENADRMISKDTGWPVSIKDAEGKVIYRENDILKKLVKG